jgi:hypothetical protein
MPIQAINNTGGSLTYGPVTIGANATITVQDFNLLKFRNDPNLKTDIEAGNISISDTVTTFTGDSAVFILDKEINFRVRQHKFSSFQNLTGNVTTTLKSGSGVLKGILINNNTTGGTLTLYDNTSASGTKIATMTIGTPSGGLLSGNGQGGPFLVDGLNIEFKNGLTVVTAGSTSNDITVLYR